MTGSVSAVVHLKYAAQAETRALRQCLCHPQRAGRAETNAKTGDLRGRIRTFVQILGGFLHLGQRPEICGEGFGQLSRFCVVSYIWGKVTEVKVRKYCFLL